MSSLRDGFHELLARLSHGRELGYASYKPIFYLVFPPRKIVEVKRELPAWTARLKNEGWEPRRLSMAQVVNDLLQAAPPGLRKLWAAADRAHPLAWDKTNQALANLLNGGPFLTRFGEELDKVRDRPDAVLLVTDLEALHPYLRIGAVENQLYDRFGAPTVFLYPGERTGKTRLKFLGFYHDDGNYRSVHIGG